MAYRTLASSIPQTNSEIEIQTSPRATSDGASSSSTAVDSNNSIPYDVFINHRGEVKKTFAGHLYRALLSRGLRPFLDQQDLKEGLPFPSQLSSVIGSASIHVAIFSPKYAESRWCLDELLLMLGSGAPIIPVFYHVHPAELRWTDQNKNGAYARSLHELQMKKTLDSQTHQEKLRYDSAIIQNWRDALSRVADISGFDLDGAFNGDEGHMLEKIVERVVKLSKRPPYYVAKYPTGLNEKVADFETAVLKQQQSGKVQVAGIVGLGGVGKTTLALELFNSKRLKYDKSYFLSDIRENANKSSLHSLQRVLLRGLNVNELDLRIQNIYEGKGIIERHLKSSHVLLILDDIDHEDQLEALLPAKDVLRPDSLILITSRSKDVLARAGLEQSCIYKLKGLSRQHSLELFCSHAFCQAHPLQGFEDLVDQFLEVCEGLPLALKVLGAHLFLKDKSYWKAELHKSKVSPEIKNRLKISYDALSEEEQQIFLDIAFFFVGENKISAIAAWDRSGWNGLSGFTNLEGKCLVEVDDENDIHMHDVLRDMAREVAEYQSPRRLCCPTDNFHDWLHKHSSVISEARGIRLLPDEHSTEREETRSHLLSWYRRNHQLLGNRMMKLRNRMYNKRYRFLGISVMNLQLVETEGHLLDPILRVRLPNLVWLFWRNCPYICLPLWINIKNLRVLKVERSVLETLWQGRSQAPLQLQELKIIGASRLTSIPKSIGQLKHLHHMDLSWCQKLERLPDSFGSLTNLRHMNLLYCKKLKSLPDSFGSLTNLSHMYLPCCYNLESLPDSFGSLTNLRHMNLILCKKLKRLPDSFGSLTNLRHMNLTLCKKLKRLPDSFGRLTNLHHMDLSRCNKLEGLPDSLGRLTNLQYMNLSRCNKLEGLPDSLGSLTNLQYMDLSWCNKLEGLPNSLGGLTNLHHMDLTECKKLERLPDSLSGLTNLHHMDLTDCKKLERLPDSLGGLTNLHHMDLTGCRKLERLPDSFGCLSNLKYFDASFCSKLTISSETFGNIGTLEHIDLTDCEKVEVWPSQVAHQRSLKTLKLTGTNFKELPSAFELPKHLEVLWIGNPILETVMHSLGDLGDLPNLKELGLEYRGDLKCLSGSVEWSSQLSWLKVAASPITHTSDVLFDDVVYCNLREFTLEECKNVVDVGTLPRALTSVTLISCYNLRSIEGLCGLPKLRKLNIELCINLLDVGTLPRALTSVNLIRCYNLRSIEGLCGLPKLRELRILVCNELEELPNVKTMVSLEILSVSNCLKLKSIRNLAQLTKLKHLTVGECPQLGELEGVAYCTSLGFLSVKGCPKLRLGEKAQERLRQKCIIFELEE